MPDFTAMMKTFAAVDDRCGMTGAFTWNNATHQAERTATEEKAGMDGFTDYVFTLLVTGIMNPMPKPGDPIYWGGRKWKALRVDDAETETRLHLGKCRVEDD